MSPVSIDVDWLIPPSAECVWGCGRSTFNLEHVIGQQFAKEMGLPYPLVLRWATFGMEQEKLEIALPDRVCRVCNGNWMRKLDNHAKKVMSIRERVPVVVGATSDRLKLARWALKVGLLLSLWFHDQAVREPKLVEATASVHPNHPSSVPHVPLQDFAGVRKDQRPRGDQRVWFGAAGSAVPEFFLISNGLTIRGQPREPAGYSALFSLKSLVVFVVVPAPAHRDDIDAALGTTDPAAFFPELLVPVWPDQGELTWPPRRRLQTSDIEQLIGASADWGSGRAATFPTWRPGGVQSPPRGG